MINNFPLVSCIIPAHNSAKSIKETIISVANQSYKHLEIIVVNDKSTDSTKDIVFEMVKSENLDIRYYENPGFGACSARNHGFNHSHGDYIQFLDSDDLLGTTKIESQIEALSQFSHSHVASGIWGRFYQNPKDVSWEVQLINKSYNNPAQWLLDSWMGGGMGQTAIWLSPRKIIEESGGWSEDLKINQDGEFFSRILLKSKGLVFCPDAKVYYRSGNPQSISQQNNFNREKAESLLHSFQLYKKNASDHNLTSFLRKGLGQNFLSYMYTFHRWYNDLTFIAEKEFSDLGFSKPWPVGGSRFKWLVRLFGFKNSLILKRKIHFR